jgi:hypothetical protein
LTFQRALVTSSERIPSVFLVLLSSVFFYGSLYAQETVVQGKVTDANSGDPIPFVNVVFKGTTTGGTTDFDGNFAIHTNQAVDSVTASYVGYNPRTKAIVRGTRQTINFQLSENVVNLQEVVIHAGENPAFEIMRNVISNKNNNDKRKLIAYEHDTYTKVEIDVDNISDELRDKTFMKKIARVMDSVERIAGDDGKPILPLLISESISKVYYRDNPRLKKEFLEKTKISGVGMEDGTMIQQLVGSSFQEYNFYQNWLNILTKEFVSPVADGWRLYYEYDLTDSLFIGDDFCYRLDFFPKSPQDLAFTGTMWITKQDWAVKQIDATMGRQANINFVEKMKIQQELERTETGAWLPVKNRVMIDVGELNQKAVGMLAKFYTSNRNFVVDKPRNIRFYEQPISMAEDVRMFEDEKYWDTLRHEPLSPTEVNVYKMIDTLRNIPVVKTYTDILKIALDGYFTAGRFDVGPYLGWVAYNNIEGLRVQAGFRTNIHFSNRIVLAGQLAYGFSDERIKYSATFRHILSRERWTTFAVRARSDIFRVGVDDNTFNDNPIWDAATRWGYFRRGYYFDDYSAAFQRELFKGFSQRVGFKYWTFNPTYNFGYYTTPGDVTSPVLDTFQSSEVIFESRYARDELFIIDDNERISMGTTRSPIYTLRYTHGFKGAFGSDFEYDKLKLTVFKTIKTGPLGVGYATIGAEYIFDTLPYPLLGLHLGNQTPIYTSVLYNLMNYGEFISDHYVSLQYRQYFEGLFLNRIPLIQKLNWRLLATTNIISGGMRQSNWDMISALDPEGEETLTAGRFENGKPYVEVGYGVENIFKFLRVDFIHRLTYLQNPGARKFGVLVSAQFQL